MRILESKHLFNDLLNKLIYKGGLTTEEYCNTLQELNTIYNHIFDKMYINIPMNRTKPPKISTADEVRDILSNKKIN